MVRGNAAILTHVEDGRALRVFDGVGGEVTYVGEFALDSREPWYLETAPETGGGPLRQVIKFRLAPVGEFFDDGNTREIDGVSPELDGEYRTAEENPKSPQRDPFEVDPDAVDRALAAQS